MSAAPASLADLAEQAEELDLLRDAARHVLANEWTSERARTLLDADEGWAAELWASVTEVGWADLLLDGAGGTVPQLCALTEALGESLAALPLATSAAASLLTGRSPSERFAVMGGEATLQAGEGIALSAHIPLVPFGDVADEVVVLARGTDPVVVAVDVASAGVEREPLRTLDRLPCASVVLDHVPVPESSVLHHGDDALRRWREASAAHDLAVVAELTGVAATANAAAVAYAKERIAFGRPIGAYQSVKHRLVDQRSAIEVSRALVARAAHAQRIGQDDATALTALACFWAVGELRPVAEGALQVFGGIGYTWEHDAHLALRRAAVLTALLGPRRQHRHAVGVWIRDLRPPTT